MGTVNGRHCTLFAALALLLAGVADAQQPLIQGLDHIPIVVADLAQAEKDFRAMGFAIKPGRFHGDGIRNAHVKFPDGTELELITAAAAVDPLTGEYRRRLRSGDGPVYFGLYAPDLAALLRGVRSMGMPLERDGGALVFPLDSPLHSLFFGAREKAPTDRPEHFAHPNGAVRLSGVWVREQQGERLLLQRLRIPMRRSQPCGPIPGRIVVAELPEASVNLVTGAGANSVIGARVEVKNLAALEKSLQHGHFEPRKYECDPHALWLSPVSAHGIWLQFVTPGP